MHGKFRGTSMALIDVNVLLQLTGRWKKDVEGCASSRMAVTSAKSQLQFSLQVRVRSLR